MAIDIEAFRTTVQRADDGSLLDGFAEWVGRDRRVTAALLVLLAEIDRRGTHAGLGHASLFSLCVERFHMSESAAGKRIHAARAAARWPVLFEMVAKGEIHLSGINRLAAHLTGENHRDVLARARHRTTREIEALVAEIAPRPDVPSRVRALPRRPEALLGGQHGSDMGSAALPRQTEGPIDATAVASTPDAPGVPPADEATVAVPPAGEPPAQQSPRAQAAPATGRVSPLAPRRYRIELTVGQETHDKLRALQGLLPDTDPAAIFERAIGELLDRTLAKKAALTSRPRPSKPEAERRTGRGIPAADRRRVWMRDGGRCAFVGSDGHRCTGTRHLEFHHVEPYARGGGHGADNLELRCRKHNQHQADLDYGKPFMDAKRRGDDQVREPLAEYNSSRAHMPHGMPLPLVSYGGPDWLPAPAA
jgi:5-methylcytosine-specific restriction endonuclease McrA